jgi:hypothetical protein
MEILTTGEKPTQSQCDSLEEKTHVWVMREKVNGHMKYYIDGNTILELGFNDQRTWT